MASQVKSLKPDLTHNKLVLICIFILNLKIVALKANMSTKYLGEELAHGLEDGSLEACARGSSSQRYLNQETISWHSCGRVLIWWWVGDRVR